MIIDMDGQVCTVMGHNQLSTLIISNQGWLAQTVIKFVSIKLISCTFQVIYKRHLCFNWHLNLIEVCATQPSCSFGATTCGLLRAKMAQDIHLRTYLRVSVVLLFDTAERHKMSFLERFHPIVGHSPKALLSIVRPIHGIRIQKLLNNTVFPLTFLIMYLE
jgi:hypothetical protein